MIVEDTLYRQICASMPIPCVDLAVVDPAGMLLMVRRVEDPSAGEWWFPGGRIHFGEHHVEL